MNSGPVKVARTFEDARAVADAVLYEGYLLYPYRRSSGKNRVRWQFGVIVPPAWAEAHGLDDTSVAGSAEASWQQTECLLSAPEDTTVRCRVRFLQTQRKMVEERLSEGTHRPVDALNAGERLEVGFDEAVPQEFDFQVPLRDLLSGDQEFTFQAPGGEETEPVLDDEGRARGRTVRRRWPLTATVTMSATLPRTPCDAPHKVGRVRVRIDNADTATAADAPRDEALLRSLLACHVLLGTDEGAFVSLLDPPQWAARAAKECANVHTFPVLAGAPGDGHAVLSSPILMYDHPRVAPESPGDLHDATEIDEILSLRTLTLTDEEKREARGTDRRAAAILDRTEALSPEAFARLHGTLRFPEPGETRSPLPGDDGDGFVVAGVRVAKGSRVRLRPRSRGTDPQDRFLDGRTALVEAVMTDVDDATHFAVTVEDDPAADLNQWYGRYRYFAPDEVEPLPAANTGGGAAVSRVLVAGIGNVFLADDGFGVEVVRRMDGSALPENVDVADYGIRGVHLAYELLNGRHHTLIMVDAVPVEGPPGTLAVIAVDTAAFDEDVSCPDPSDPLGPPAVDGHGMEPMAVLRLLRRLGGEVARVFVVGCRPGVIEERMELSEPVRAALDEAVRLVTELARDEASAEMERTGA